MNTVKSRAPNRRAFVLAVFLGLVSMQWLAPAQAGVLPADSVVGGKTIGDWTAKWWAWALSYPIDRNPLLDDTGRLGRLGNVGGPVFFVVTSGGGKVVRKHKVPAGKHLLVPLYTYLWTFDADCDNAHCAREIADGAVMAVSKLSAKIDGQPVKRLFSHYETKQGTFNVTVPDDGLYGPGEGGTFKGVTSGYWLMLEPLSPGKHHLFFDAVGPVSDTESIHFTTDLEVVVE